MTEFATLYGNSLYALAQQENIEARIYADLEFVGMQFKAQPDYVKLLDAPMVTLQEKCELLDAAFKANLHPYTCNFLKLLAEKKQMHAFAYARQVYTDKYNEANNIEPAVAVTAVPLSARLQEKLTDKLSKMTGKTIVLENKVDPHILGGLTIRMANRQVDASVRSRLNALEKQLSERW